MSNKQDRKFKPRKSFQVKKSENPPSSDFPNVVFDGFQTIDIPADAQQSPVETHLSLLSNPSEFKFMDEIALLKRGRIDKDAPKHPYNRGNNKSKSQKMEKSESEEQSCGSSMSSKSSKSDSSAKSSAINSVMSFMGGKMEKQETFKIGKDGELKYANMKVGGERYEVSSGKLFGVYQQSSGQTCLFTFRN